MRGGKFELRPKSAVEVLAISIIFGCIQVSEAEERSLHNAKTHACGSMPGAHAVRVWLGQWLRGIKDQRLAACRNCDLFRSEGFDDAHRSVTLRTFWNDLRLGEHRRCFGRLIQESAAERQ